VKITNLVLVAFLLLLVSVNLLHPFVFAQSHLPIEKKPEMFYNYTGKYYEVYHGSPSGIISMTLPEDKLNFSILPIITYNNTVASFSMELKPELMNLYHQIGFTNKSQNAVFVYPVFTQAAYSQNGFYDYYNKKCDSKCLTVDIPSSFNGTYSSSIVAAIALNLLNYSFITDVDIDKDPEILKQYDTVIMLHNEYVTANEFHAVTEHPHVIYLYPNVLYAKVEPNYDNNTITLVQGHGYPDEKIQNGFDWKYDNTKFEYDLKCENWNFTDIDNGKMLNCYPDYAILHDKSILGALKDFTERIPIPEFNSVIGMIVIIGIIGAIMISSRLNMKS